MVKVKKIKSLESKVKDKLYHKQKYANKSEEQRKAENHINYLKKKEKILAANPQKAAVIAMKVEEKEKKEQLKAAIALQRFHASAINRAKNSAKCKKFRENEKAKKVASILIGISKVRAIRSELREVSQSNNYNEHVEVELVEVEGQGMGVRAITNILPATVICKYGGNKITDEDKILQLLENHNDKIIQHKTKKIWWDGTKSSTMGPKVNHACNCESNCEFVFIKNEPYLSSRASEEGNIKSGEYLTVDYNYDFSENTDFENDEMWYKLYMENHVCKLK